MKLVKLDGREFDCEGKSFLALQRKKDDLLYLAYGNPGDWKLFKVKLNHLLEISGTIKELEELADNLVKQPDPKMDVTTGKVKDLLRMFQDYVATWDVLPDYPDDYGEEDNEVIIPGVLIDSSKKEKWPKLSRKKFKALQEQTQQPGPWEWDGTLKDNPSVVDGSGKGNPFDLKK